MMIINEMICVERRTEKILSNDDDDDNKDDDDVLIMMMIVVFFRSFFPQPRIFAITSQLVHTVDVQI